MRLQHHQVSADREQRGREASPTAAIVDSPSVKIADQKRGARGYDAGKKITGRKRYILTETDGRLLEVHLHSADMHNRDGAQPLQRRSRARFSFVEKLFVRMAAIAANCLIGQARVSILVSM